jgi:hypothetical protein
MRHSAMFSPCLFSFLRHFSVKVAPALLGIVAWSACTPLASASTPSTITLTVTAAGSPVTTVASATVVTLTASVRAGAVPVSPGLVKFCDATAPHCTDIHVIGTAQLTASGTATLRFRPGIGSHSYNAIFVGTTATAPSTSSVATLAVPGSSTGLYRTTTSIAQAGTQGNYTLTATVTGLNVTAGGPTGIVSFLDTTSGNTTLGTASLGSPFGSPSFNIESSILPNTYPLVVVSADFNGDGIPDVATPAYGAVQVLLGNGDGTLTALPSTALPNSSSYLSNLVVADFNSDGIPDIVANANVNTATAVILLGNGDGTFSLASSSSVDNVQFGSNSFVVGDFNGDGITDIATGIFSVQVLLGNGDGTFSMKPQPLPNTFGSGIVQFVAGDFNGDGIQDLVASVGSGDIVMLTGNGDGTFTRGSLLTVPGRASIAAGDLNVDGILDLAVGVTDTLITLRGNGDGTFILQTTLNLPSETRPIVIGDLNGDAIPDVITPLYANSLISAFGNGDGTFTLGPSVPTPSFGPWGVAVADLDGDGIQDIIAGGTGIADVITLFNQASQTATASLSNVSDPGHDTHEVLASYPGDGAFAASTSGTTSLIATPPITFPTTLTLISTQNSSLFNTPVTFTATLSPYTYTGSSSDGDSITFVSRGQSIGTGILSAGVATLTVSNLPPGTNTITATFPGDNNFAPATSNALAQSVQVSPNTSLAITSSGSPVITVTAGSAINLTATVTNSGIPFNIGQVTFCDASAPFCIDIHLLGSAQVLPNGTASLKLIPSPGTHSYKAVVTVAGSTFSSSSVPLTVTAVPLPTMTALAETVDSIGMELTATVTGRGGTVPLTGTVDFTDVTNPPSYHLGTTTLGAETITQQLVLAYGSYLTGPTDIPLSTAVADFNGDGIPDFFVPTGPSPTAFPNNIPTLSYVMLGQGDGINFQRLPGPVLPVSCASIATADFNGDGKVDVAAFSDSAPAVLLGKGDGTFTTTGSLSDSTCNHVVAGDFNKDGKTDLAVLGAYNNQLILWLGNGDGTFTALAPITYFGLALHDLLSGDFNGDTNLDLAVMGSGNALYVLRNNGDGTFQRPDVTTGPSISGTAVAADLNTDGRTDLAIFATNGLFTTLLANADGSFTSVTNPPISFSTSPAIGDFNGDGKIDLIGADASATATVLLGNGDGTFITGPSQAPPNFSSSLPGDNIYSNATQTITASDLNGDGLSDVIIGISVTELRRGEVTGGEYSFLSLPVATATASRHVISLPDIPSSSFHTVSTAYSGDTIYSASTGTQDFQATTSILTLASNVSSSVYGTPVTFLAKLSPYNAQGLSTDDELVTFTSGGATLGTAALSSGAATISINSLPVGQNTVTATYAGDDNFARTTTNLVIAVTSRSFITFAVPPHLYGDAPFAVAATSPSTGAITYSVLSGPAAISGATVTITGAGTVVLQASQAATNTYLAAAKTATFTVGKVNLTLTAGNAVRVFGAVNSTFTGTLNGAVNGDTLTETFSTTATAASPVGTYPIVPSASGPKIANYIITATNGTLTVTEGSFITFTVPTHTYGNAPFAVAATSPSTGAITYSVLSGPATVSGSTVTITGAGTVALRASQTAAGGYLASTQTASFLVNKAALSATANNIARVFGAANPTFTGTLMGAVNGDILTENFSTNATAASPVGSYLIVPTVSGAKVANYTVTATNGALTITQVGTATTFSLSNQNTTLTATVASLTSGVPTGSVTFSEGQTPVGTGTLVNGIATVTTTSFPAGNVVITAQYSGDANFTQSSSPPIFILAVTATNTSLSVPQTGSVTDAFTISPAPGYTGTVQFSCSSLPPNATCSFQPSSVTFTGSNPTASVTATIHTGVSTQLALLTHPISSREGGGGLLVAGLFCPSIFVFCIVRRQRVVGALPRDLILPLLLLGCMGTLFTGCARTSKGGTTIPPTTTPSNSATQTPTGSFPINLNVSGSNGLSQTTSLKLTVH